VICAWRALWLRLTYLWLPGSSPSNTLPGRLLPFSNKDQVFQRMHIFMGQPSCTVHTSKGCAAAHASARCTSILARPLSCLCARGQRHCYLSCMVEAECRPRPLVACMPHRSRGCHSPPRHGGIVQAPACIIARIGMERGVGQGCTPLLCQSTDSTMHSVGEQEPPSYGTALHPSTSAAAPCRPRYAYQHARQDAWSWARLQGVASCPDS